MASDFDMVAPLKFVDNMLKVVKAPRGEDFVDMLNSRITSMALFVSAIACFARDYMGNPIHCWGNAEWRRGWVQYAHDYCLVENTYYIPMQQKGVPYNRTELVQQQEISYYQWMPFILILQGLLFMAPLIIWKALDGTVSGIPVQTVLSMAREATTSASCMDSKDRRNIAHHMKVCLDDKYGDGVKFPVKIYRFISQRSLAFLYCFTKILFIGNSLLQFYLLGRFLGKSSHIWGFSTLNALRNGESWLDTGLFPRVTMCDLQVRQAGGGHIQRYTVQCVLAGNMVNEKIFVLLWWWLIILNALTVASLVHWLVKLSLRSSRLRAFHDKLVLSVQRVHPEPPTEDSAQEKDNEESQSDNYDSDKEEEEGDNYDEEDSTTNKPPSDASTDKTAPVDQAPPIPTKASKSKTQRRHDVWYRKQKQFITKIEQHYRDFFEWLGIDGILMFELMEINSSGFVASNVLGRLFLSWEPRDKNKNEQWRTDEIARLQLVSTDNYETAGTLTYHQNNYKAPYIVSKQYEVDGSPL